MKQGFTTPAGEVEALRRRVQELEAEVSGLRSALPPVLDVPDFLMRLNLLESIDDGFAAFDPDWRFTYVNRMAEGLLGRTAESLIGQNFWDEYAGLLGTDAELVCRGVMESRIPAQTEVYYPPLHGWFEGRFFPSPDGGVFVFFTNITARKQQDAALRESEQRWRSLADALPQFVWISESPTKAAFINDYWFQYTGLPKHDLSMETWSTMLHPDNLERIGAMWQQALATGEEKSFEYRVKRRQDGQWRWHFGFHRPMRNGQGDIINWVGTAFDIHDRKTAQQQLINLEESQRLAVKAGGVGLWDWDIAANHVAWSDQTYQIHGLRPDQFNGTVEGFTSMVHPDDLERMGAAIQHSVETGAPYQHDFRIVRPDGEVRWLTTSAHVVQDSHGRTIRMLGATLDVTERKNTEEALQSLIQHAPDALLVAGRDGYYTEVNPSACALLGYSREEMLQKTARDLARPEDQNRIEQLLANLVSGARVITDWELRHKNGEWIPVEVSTSILPDGRRQSFVRDIRERRRLERTAMRLAAIVEFSDDAIISKDLLGQITSWNRGAQKLFGYTAEEVIGRPVSILSATESSTEMSSILERIRRGEQVAHFETVRRTKDGRLLPISLTVSPIQDGSGRIIGASKIARDITDRKAADQERAELLAREKEARQTAELLNRVGPTLAAELDLHRLVQSVTDIATELVAAEFGAFFHNVVQDNGESYMLYTLSGVPREAFAKFPMPRNTAVFGPTFRGEGIVRSEDITKDPRYGKNPPHHGMPEGHLPVCSYLAAPVTSHSGEVLGGLFFGHSQPGRFNERHEAILQGIAAQAAIAMDNARLFRQAQAIQSELKRSNEDLRRANDDLETFAYSASHDLQEPLRTITISAQLLERRAGNLSDESKTFLKSVLEGASRMKTLIQDLLLYTRATKAAEGPPPLVDSGAVLGAVLNDLKTLLEQTNGRVVYTALPQVPMHEIHLTQLFQNLISNSLKYRNEEHPYVHVSANQEDGWIVFTLEDNGIGIDPQYKEQIFGLFKRLHTREQYAGSGIGLAICHRILEQYGGRIWVERSEPGRGSSFRFSLPARPVR